MTSFIIIVVIILFIVLVGFTWYRAEAFDGMERVIICVAGILLSWAITSILFKISANGIEYINLEVEKEISKILILVFTPINGIIYMPYISKLISQYKFDEIKINEISKKILILAIILIIVFAIEVAYLKNIQLGIFDVANKI